MNTKKPKVRLWSVLTALTAILTIAAIVGNMIANQYATTLNVALNASTYKIIKGNTTEDTEYFKAGFASDKEREAYEAELCATVEAEGAALLKNDNAALPLAGSAKVSLFGHGSVDLMYGGTGSGSVDTSKAPNLKEALEAQGIQVNQTLWDLYKSDSMMTNYSRITPASISDTLEANTQYAVNEAPWSALSSAESSFAEYGDAAIVVFSRSGGEGADLPSGANGTNDSWISGSEGSGNYLELSAEEIELLKNLKALKDNGTFKSIVVLINSSNALEMDFLNPAICGEDYGIDAAMWIGDVGQTGINGVGQLLAGTVTPSGSLVDTYLYDNLANPAMYNFYTQAYPNAAEYNLLTEGADVQGMYSVYQEGIYLGYRYFETRYEDVVMGTAKAGDYDWATTVAYPFGYGDSYTTFAYSNFNVAESDDAFTVTLKVTNTGKTYSGKETVQVYFQSPYTDYDKANGIEKAAAELCGFAKTDVLAPGASEDVTITVKKSELRTYDANNAKTYILDAGDYYITAAKNAHDAVNNILAVKGKTVEDGMTADGNTEFVATYTPANGTVDTTTYKNDTTTGVEVTNQLDQANGGFQYLSRNDWTGTWPTTDGEVSDQISTWGNPINGTDANGNPASYTYYKTISSEDLAKLDSFDSLNTTDPSTLTDELVYGKDNGLGLIDMRGLDYNDPKWNDLLDQLTPSDYQTLITQSGYGTAAIKSVDKLSTTDRDAATGLVNYGVDASGNFYFKGNITHCGVIVLAQTYNDDLATHYGENIGDESYYLDVDGWYAPAVNMHRTAFSGRNSEYYSEDPFIGGHIASLECEGVASRGMYVFVKHYAINDQEDHRGDREGQYSIATFLNEQAAREIYLKPFEMCVKSDKVEMNYAKDNGDGTYSNATTEIPSVTGIMTSFNRVGYTWAGGNYNMITGLLRNEWGFHGFIITDNANTGVFMDAGQMIQAGADGKLTNLPTGARYTFNKNDVSDYHYGREAVHNILYTIANSKAMNGGMPGSRYLAKVEPYQKVIYAVDGVCGGLIAVLVILTIFRFRKKKEDNIKTV